MAKSPIIAPRALTEQPDIGATKKDQKGFRLSDTYNAQEVNSEIDRLHQRLNGIIVEDDALADLDSGATLAEVITRLNAITSTIRKSGLRRQS